MVKTILSKSYLITNRIFFKNIYCEHFGVQVYKKIGTNIQKHFSVKKKSVHS